MLKSRAVFPILLVAGVFFAASGPSVFADKAAREGKSNTPRDVADTPAGVEVTNQLPAPCTGAPDHPKATKITLAVAGGDTWGYWFRAVNPTSAHAVFGHWKQQATLAQQNPPNGTTAADFAPIIAACDSALGEIGSGATFRQIVAAQNSPTNRRVLSGLLNAGLDLGFLQLSPSALGVLLGQLIDGLNNPYRNAGDVNNGIPTGLGDVTLARLYTTPAEPDLDAAGNPVATGVHSNLVDRIALANEHRILWKQYPEGDCPVLQSGGDYDLYAANMCCCNVAGANYRKCVTKAGYSCSMCATYCCIGGIQYCPGGTPGCP